jgi:branched-chain amino acid transport system ATP-binding protein
VTGVAAGPLLEARGLDAGYGSLAAVRGLDLEVRAGEIAVLLGPNGAGKTTTVLTLAGALRPLGGEVRWLGRPVDAPLHRRARDGLALVTDDRSVFMRMTVAENLRLALGPRRERPLELFPELRDHVARRVGLLSGGQQQMLALGRALAAEPRLLIADELSLGLAPIIVSRLLHAVRAAADAGLGVLLVEQFAHSALEVADRAYVLQRGEVVLGGPADEVLERFDDVESAYLA